MSETIVVPDNSGNNNGWNSPLGMLALGNGGYGYGNGGFLGGGFGAGILGGVLGGIFTNWLGGNGWGFGGGMNSNAAASLGAQATANNNTDLLMNAITNIGERQHEAVQTLSTMLGQDFNLVNQGVQTMQSALATIAANQGMNTMQVVNAIQSGNASLASQLCQCCCDMRQTVTNQGYENQLRTVEQTNTLGNVINGNGHRTVDAIADLKATMIQSFCDVKEREMQSKIDTQSDIITQLRNAADNANQTNQIIGYVNSVITPLQREVDKIRENQPNTVSVPYPQLGVYSTTPNMGNFGWNNGWNNGWWGNGWGNNVVF